MSLATSALGGEVTVAGRTRPIENSGVTLIEAPSLDAIAKRIRHEHGLTISAGKRMLEHAILCGDALREARARVKQGTWTRWVEDNVQLNVGTAGFYMRASFFVETLRENNISTIEAARTFLTEQQLLLPSSNRQLSDDQVEKIRALAKTGMPQRQIARAVGCEPSTVRKYLHDPERGTHRTRGAKYQRKRGRRALHVGRIAITDDLVEGMAIWLTESFSARGYPSQVTDVVRNDACDALRAALTFNGPIPGER